MITRYNNVCHQLCPLDRYVVTTCSDIFENKSSAQRIVPKMMSLFSTSCRRYLVPSIKSGKRRLRGFAARATREEVSTSPDVVEDKEKFLIIKCKNEQFNFYHGDKFDKFKPILATKGWQHRKAVGDYFVLYPNRDPDEPPSDSDLSTFVASNLDQRLVENLVEMSLSRPSEIQKLALPVLLSGRNSIVAAQTGCGKTLAYLLPIMEQIIRWKRIDQSRTQNEPLAIVLSPSRELTAQIGAVAKRLSKDTDVRIRVISGGHTKRLMTNPQFNEVDLLIGSFGAVSKLTTTRILKMNAVRHVVLEEADTLLDDSFNEKLRHFLKKIKFSFARPEPLDKIPESSQLTLVSATMPSTMPEALNEIINTDSLVRVTTEKLHKILPSVPQKFIRVNMSSRPVEVLKIAKANNAKKHPTIIFCNHKKTCEWLHMFLNEMGINCGFTHGTLAASMRSDAFAEFQRGQLNVLVTTDACARGLDTILVTHVINYDFPLYTSDYIHRCGRTGRLGSPKDCYVTNFICKEEDVKLLQKMETAMRNFEPLPHVNGNITKLIQDKIQRKIDAAESQQTKMLKMIARG